MSNIILGDHIFFLIIGVIIPLLSLMRGKIDMEEVNLQIKDKKKFYYANGGVLWIGVFIVVVLWIIARRSFVDLGLQWPYMDVLVWSLTGLFIIAYIIETISELKIEGSEDEVIKSAPFLPKNWSEFFSYLFLAFSAGICEEVVYRGFMVNYLMSVFEDPIIGFNMAVIFPAIVFGVVHMYQGMKSVLKISIMSLLFSTIFIFSQSLLIVVVLHSAVDIAGGWIGMRIAQKYQKEVAPPAPFSIEEEE